MLPKNSKHFIQPTAEQLGISTEAVEDIVSFFYSDLRRALIDMRGPNIMVENLGSFKAKPKELPKLIIKYRKHLNVLKPETFNQMQTKRNVQAKLEKTIRLHEQIQKERFRKKEFYKKKNEEV